MAKAVLGCPGVATQPHRDMKFGIFEDEELYYAVKTKALIRLLGYNANDFASFYFSFLHIPI